MRTGIGYDSHRFAAGRKLILGGVEIPFEKGFDGHSDADVLVHAVIDAVMGAAKLGDIGKAFPDSDMSFKDISSILLLEKTAELLAETQDTVSTISQAVGINSTNYFYIVFKKKYGCTPVQYRRQIKEEQENGK